ncbi:Uu.00g040010.m01.CDS01 [Anthostomella pinea]|uniref:Uu.00g040010.m01.CDS01 n=1 Tax=Anthostomella pinea TaxID=933095 RepID=A0AAI8VA81_9PEZI|nr:Uu.00g040010.m01.CDS01 [Anthostomella pinea]
MAQAHEDTAAELHATLQQRQGGAVGDSKDQGKDMTGGRLPSISVEKSHSADTADGEEPNAHEIKTLRRVGDAFPKAAYLIAVVELCERFTYYGCQGLFQNYISNRPGGQDGAAGLGLGHAGATGLNVFFQFACYITPIFGAIIADQYLGKYKTILVFAAVYFVGLILLWTTALPAAIESGASLGGFITAIIINGMYKYIPIQTLSPRVWNTLELSANFSAGPFYTPDTRHTMAVSTDPKTGERIIIDPAITYQRIYMMFYFCINVGCLSLLATPFMERYVGFWSAYLLCWLMFCVAVVVLIICRGRYIVRPPQGSIITDSFKAIGMMIVSRNTDAAKPSWRAAMGKTKPVPWNDHFVDELKRALRACKVFCFYPIFWICYGQFSSNFVSQAAQMEGHGMPNDLMQNFDPISILVFIPILDRIVYPLLRKMNIELKPIARISIGFMFAGLCLAYAAIVQHIIYSTGPCFDRPGACPAGMDGESPLPNHVHIAVQTPAYVLIGISEIFISVTGLEYAYTKAPPSMKSFVQSLYLFTSAIGSALNEALVPATGDPAIMWMYTGVAILAVVTSFGFYGIFHKYDSEEAEMNKLDATEHAWDARPNSGTGNEHVPTEKV